MPPKFTSAIRTLCVVLALGLVTAASAADRKALIGLTREQVVEQLGEVKSSINAGSREILFFERDRVTLRNNVVIEVDGIPVLRPAPAPVVPAPQPVVDPLAPPVEPVPAPAPGTTVRNQPVAPAPGPAGAPRAPVVDPVAPPQAAQPQLPPPPPPVPEGPAPLAIRTRPANRPTTSTPAATPTTQPTAENPPAAGAPVAQEAAPSASPSAPAAASASSSDAAGVAPTDGVAVAQTPAALAADAAKEKDEAAPAPKTPPAETKKKAARRRVSDAEYVDPTAALFNVKNFAIVGIIIVGGVGYIMWRAQQRTIALAATTVSRTPFSTPPIPPTAGPKFDAAFLAKLEWKSFERLVAAYYSKTGVVATSTKSPPSSPVHIKILWKGETRPFAYVRCIAHPIGLVQAVPLQELFQLISTEDIRRGYVVTTGKFGVPARDFAEEKHLTLLTGDLFLEKLNALPDSARTEIMNEITASDYTTPTCPKCDVKMVPLDDTTWRCPNHPRCEVTMPVRKV